MKTIITYSALFGLFFCLQVFIFNRLEIGYGAQIFILPLFLMILPFETNVFGLMTLGFLLGISVDAFSNTFGLNASTLVLFAYLRPIVFESFRPREGYDPLKIPTAIKKVRLLFSSSGRGASPKSSELVSSKDIEHSPGYVVINYYSEYSYYSMNCE